MCGYHLSINFSPGRSLSGTGLFAFLARPWFSNYNLPMKLTLNLITGDQLEQNISKKVCIIGRSSQCDIVVAHESMSRKHCQIELKDGEIFVTDLGSSNGVLINNEKITPNVPVRYQTFLGLAFGAVQSVSIETESAPVVSPVAEVGMRSKESRGHTTQTHTKPNLTRPVEKKPAPKSANNLIKILILILVLAALAYVFLTPEENRPPTPAEIYE